MQFFHPESVPSFLPVIDFASIQPIRSLQHLHSSPPGVAILKLFQQAGLKASLGFNPGHGGVSLSFLLPLPTTTTTTTTETTAAAQSTSPAVESPYTDDAIERKQSLDFLQDKDMVFILINAMLGLLPCQAALQSAYEDYKRQSVTTTTTTASLSLEEALFSNVCLRIFAKQTTTTISGIVHDFRQKTMRVSFCSNSDILDATTGKKELLLGLASCKLKGFDMVTGRCGKDLMDASKETLATEMIEQFWNNLELNGYHASDELTSILKPVVGQFIRSGIREDGTFCGCSRPVSLYLHGNAGAGKSSLVRALCLSMESMLQLNFDPAQPVRVVKVLLNSVTPSDLARNLRVKGISDMSIERIVEQTVWRQGLVILHLEEAPKDQAQQVELLSKVQDMLDSVRGRYPKEAANVMLVITSNYHPAPSLGSSCTAVIDIDPPSQSQQNEWCCKMLSSGLKDQFQFSGVEVEIKPPLKRLRDMRPLTQWHRSVSFHIWRHLMAVIGEDPNKESMSVKIQVLMGAKTSLADEDDEQVAAIAVVGGCDDDEQEEPGCESSNPLSPASGLMHNEQCTVKIAIDSHVSEQKDLAILKLYSTDGFFFWSEEEEKDVDQMMVASPSVAWGVHRGQRPLLHCIAKMVQYNYLKPAVVVLTGEEEGQELATQSLKRILEGKVGDEAMIATEVSITTEADKEKVFGPPTQILGGLFRFIDTANNPNVCKGQRNYAVIVARVNVLGQFILRELLEDSKSRTHRQSVEKDRVMFILCLQPGTAVTPQLKSRAMAIIQCC